MVSTISLFVLGALIGFHMLIGMNMSYKRVKIINAYDLQSAIAMCVNKIIGAIFIGTMIIAIAILLK